MATWAKCPDLFLYTKGKDVYLWRCNETTTWMPMKTADFDDLGKVTDYLDLIGGKDSILEWDKSSYIDLVAYISPRRLLVNSQGLVIAELHKFGQDGKMDENELPIYVRSLDVLSLKPFGLRDRTISSRTVRYLEADGRAAPVEGSTTTTTTSTELDDEKRELIAANKTLKNDKEAADKKVTELKEMNKTLKGENEAREKKATELKERNKGLVEDVAAQKTVATNAQQERDAAKREKEAAEKQVAKLKETNKTLKMDKEAAEKKTVGLQAQFDALNEKKEVWMNSLTDQLGNWVSFGSLSPKIHRIVASKPDLYVALFTDGENVEHELTTNVHPSYLYYGELADNNNVPIKLPHGTTGFNGFRAIKLDELIPNKEKARFGVNDWYRGMFNGDMYAIRPRFIKDPLY